MSTILPVNSGDFLFTSESVTEGHPDKMCDQISDAVLDALISEEQVLESEKRVSSSGKPVKASDIRCACETFVTTGTVVVAGEIRAESNIDVQRIARRTIKRIGYDRSKHGFDGDTCGVINMIHGQSPDIAAGVDKSPGSRGTDVGDPLDLIGAGDQGMMFGYATNETAAFMPMPHYLASQLARRLDKVRHSNVLPYLGPDGKTQVTVRYEDNHPVAVTAIVISAQHAESVDNMKLIKEDLIAHVIRPVMETSDISWQDADLYVNPTGRFVVGGPMGDTGLTGRKNVVDTYGGFGRHGGGAFSGKDCTKVDRSAAYAARWIAKNVVAADFASRCEIQLAYAIGVSRPLSILVNTFGTGRIKDADIAKAVQEVFDLRPGAIIRDLDLFRPIFEKTAVYGHFGREDECFTWERCNRVEALRSACGRMS